MVAAMKEKKRHEIIQSWFRSGIKVQETIAVHNLNTTAIVHGHKKANILHTAKKRKAKKFIVVVVCTSESLTCGILFMIPVRTTTWIFNRSAQEPRTGMISPWATSYSTKKASSRMRNCCFMKTKSRKKEKKRTFLLPLLSSVCCKRSEKAESSDHLQCNCLALALCVYENYMINNAPALPCLVWKGERSDLNSIKWFFFISLTIFHLLHDVLWFSNSSRNPNLLAFYFLYRAKEIVTHFLFTECLAFKCSAKFFRHLRNREKLPSFVIKKVCTKGKIYFFFFGSQFGGD